MSSVEVVRRMLPSHANPAGTVFGGEILAQCDDAAGIAATRHARARVATAKVDAMEFLAPAQIGDVLIAKAAVNAVFGSSMEVGVRVEAEDTMTGEIRHTNSAYFVMVALDEDAEPMQVPALEARGEDAQRREREANERNYARKRAERR